MSAIIKQQYGILKKIKAFCMTIQLPTFQIIQNKLIIIPKIYPLAKQTAMSSSSHTLT